MKILYSCVFPLRKARARDFGKQFLCVTTLFPRLSCLPTFVCSHSSLSFTNLPKSGIAPLASRPQKLAGCWLPATGDRISTIFQIGSLANRPALQAACGAPPGSSPSRPCVVCGRAGRRSARRRVWPGAWAPGARWGGRLGGCPIAHGSSPPRAWSYEGAPGSAARGDRRRSYPLRRPQQPPLERKNRQTPKTH